MPRTTPLFIMAALLLVVAITGCFNPFRPQVVAGIAFSEPAPRPSSPQGALQLLRWCWVNRNIAEYEELFTEDFRFFFADLEAALNPPVFRDDEINIARHLFVDGSAAEPRAKRIDLDFNSTLIPIADPRPGKTDPWHKEITTKVNLQAYVGDAIIDVDGDVTFYLVRGDSALIPQTLKDRGFLPDRGRWYIEGWEDKTGDGQSGAVIDRTLRATLAAAPAPSPTDGNRGALGAARPATRSVLAGATSVPALIRVTLSTLKLMYR